MTNFLGLNTGGAGAPDNVTLNSTGLKRKRPADTELDRDSKRRNTVGVHAVQTLGHHFRLAPVPVGAGLGGARGGGSDNNASSAVASDEEVDDAQQKNEEEEATNLKLNDEARAKIAQSLLAALFGAGAEEMPETDETPISADVIDSARKEFHEGNYHLQRRMVMNDGIYGAVVDPTKDGHFQRIFSHETHPRLKKVTDQYWSGRCWMFAGCNVMRGKVMEKYNLKDFQFSKTHLFFWDKFEKANTFLNQIIATSHEDLDSHWVQHALKVPNSDGGWWQGFVNVVEKYGLMPESAMQETMNTLDSYEFNEFLENKLREYAMRLREKAEDEEVKDEELHALKDEWLKEIYRILVINLGEPPQTFDWQYKDKDKQVHRVEGITPLEFYKDYVGTNLKDKVCLIYAPTIDEDRLGARLVMPMDQNVVGGEPPEWLTVSMKDVYNAAMKSIRHNEPVWFACATDKAADFWKGYLSAQRMDYKSVYGTDIQMTRAERTAYHVAEANHAMVLTGYDFDEKEKKPRKWQVLNSWGKDFGDKGHWIMDQDWFEKYVADVVVDKKLLPERIRKLLDKTPTIVQPWDPIAKTLGPRQ